MKVLIVEDEQPAAEKLNSMLASYDGIEVLAALTSVKNTVEWLRNHGAPELLFLDVHLADGLSFEIFEQTDVRCPVIFCTAYDQYALKAFQFHSIDYLLKPLKYEKLALSLGKMAEIRKSFSPDTGLLQVEQLRNLIKSNTNYKSRFMVRNGAKIKTVKTSEIAYFFSHNKLNLLVTVQNERFPVDYTLVELAGMLDPAMFFHVNRKFIIHIDAAKEIHPYFKGRLKLVLQPPVDEEVLVSSQTSSDFKAWLDQ